MSGLGVAEAKAWGSLGHDAGRLLETMPKPTIAAVNGFALGGGCELALACDIRYAVVAGEARPAGGEPRDHPGLGRHERLARVCGLGVAKELIFTGRTVDAEEALRIGLVNGVTTRCSTAHARRRSRLRGRARSRCRDEAAREPRARR